MVAGANVHDTKLLAATLESVVVEAPHGGDAEAKHLCLDKGYDMVSNGTAGRAAHGYGQRIRHPATARQKLDGQGIWDVIRRRWVVERTLILHGQS